MVRGKSERRETALLSEPEARLVQTEIGMASDGHKSGTDPAQP